LVHKQTKLTEVLAEYSTFNLATIAYFRPRSSAPRLLTSDLLSCSTIAYFWPPLLLHDCLLLTSSPAHYPLIILSSEATYIYIYIFFSNGLTAPWGPRPPHFSRLHDHPLFRHTTVGRIPLDEGPARRRDLYLTTHNTHNRQTSKSPAGFKPTIPVSKLPQTHALDRTATGIGHLKLYKLRN
jgi:hypothetical protein